MDNTDTALALAEERVFALQATLAEVREELDHWRQIGRGNLERLDDVG